MRPIMTAHLPRYDGVRYVISTGSTDPVELEFEWHEEKARENLSKHGVSCEEAKSVLNDPLSITIPDPAHSLDEDRFVDIGLSATAQFLVVVYTERGTRIRLISWRRATKQEQRTYEQREY